MGAAREVTEQGKQMANKKIEIQAQLRAANEKGSHVAGRLRRAGQLPGAINRLEGGTQLVKFNEHDFELALRGHANTQMIVNVTLDGKPVIALLREIQHDVMTGAPIHVDLGEVSLTKKIRVAIPIRLLGDPEGVRIDGGVLEQTLRAVEVECLPQDMIETIEADVTSLKLNQTLFVRDLKLPAAFTLITSKDSPFAGVMKIEEEVVETPAATEAAATAEAAGPEVIAKGKKEEEGEAGAEGAAEKGKEKGGKAAPAAEEKKGGKAEAPAAKEKKGKK